MSTAAPPLHLLYGGTFDPVHAGHLAVARAALAATGAPRLDLLPSADPPHRPPPGAPALDRAAMLVLAASADPRLGVDRRELRRIGPSYTADTLRAWRGEHGADRPLAFVLGADAFLGLAGWKDWTALLTLAHLLVAVRPGIDLDGLPPALAETVSGRWGDAPDSLWRAPAGRLFRLELPPQPESATHLRAQLAQGVAAPAGLPAQVARYAQLRGLYRPCPA